ncbi:hypothetical protein PybrP1_010089 [[Pythium] brassicae (nom. inval.)]|nr:hypothetical protein PybrP1_010089 [[Pythium] brassicae (nom. inval.)]
MSSSDSGGGAGGGAPPMPRKSGLVYKKAGVVRSWKLLHFSLEGSVLYYFKREGDATPKGVVVLSGCDVRLTRDKKLYSFRISHPKTSRVYDLATTLPSRTEDWVAALRGAASFVPNSAMLSRSDSSADDSGRGSSREPARASASTSLRATLVSLSPEDLDAVGVDDPAMPAVPPEYRARLESLMADFVLQARDDAPGWKLQADKRGVRASVRAASRLGSFKGVGVIAHPLHAVLRLVLAIARRHEYDPQLLAQQRVHVFDQHSFIDHLVYKAVFPAAPREFVNITHWRVLPSGAALVVAAAAERDDLCPRREPKVVRGEVVMAGFLLVPSADGASVTATYISKADVKSGIPAAMQTKLFVKQAFLIDGLRRALEDDERDSAGRSRSTVRVTNDTHFALRTTQSARAHDDPDNDNDTDSRDSDEKRDDNNDSSSGNDTDAHAFGSPAVPAAHRELIEKAIARMDAELENAAAWHLHSEKQGVKAFTKVDGSLTAARGEGFLPFPPRLLLDAAINTAQRVAVDPQLAFGGSLQRLDAQTSVDYLEYKPVFVVAGRDFSTLTHWRVLADGTIVVVAQSIEDLALCPLKEPKVVRAEVHLACWKIVPNAAYTGAHVSYLVKTDLKGSIPARLASKVAAEQPYILLRIGELLKKRKDVDEVAARGKVTNTLLAAASVSAGARQVPRKSVGSRATTAARVPREPEAEPPTANKATATATASKATAPPRASSGLTLSALASFGAQFGAALLALRTVALPSVLHSGAVALLLVWLAVQLHLGPSEMSARRKLMIASFGPPDSGMILGTLEMDVTKTRAYIARKRAATGDHVTVTHVVLRAVGAALAHSPSVNGHLVFGNYYPAPSVDISCLVAVDGGKDLGVCRLPAADKMDLATICARLRGDAAKLRGGQDKEQASRNELLRLLPTYVVRPVTNVVGWLGGAVGLRVKAVGVEPYMFGACMVTSVGMMGLDLAFAPLTAYAQTPMLVTVGAIKDKAVVVDGQVVARPILTITTTIDHRYVDGSEAARMASSVKKYIEDPSLLEP